MQRQIDTVTIPNAGNTSDYKSVPTGFVLIGFITPAAFTGTSISLMMMPVANGTPVPVYNGGTLYSETVATAASQYHALDPKYTNGLNYVAIKSSANESAVRDIILVFAK